MSRQLLVQQQGSWLVIDDNKIVHSPVRPRPDRAALAQHRGLGGGWVR